MTRRCIVTLTLAPSNMQHRSARRSLRVLASAAGASLAAAFFVWLVVHVGGKDIWRALGSCGPGVVFAVAPFAVGMSMDSLGTMVILGAMGRRTTFAQMLPVRIASEALHFSLPGGFVASDTATALLLSSRSEVPIADGVVALIARKWLVMRSHAIYVALGTLLGIPALVGLSHALGAGRALPWAVVGSSIIPLAASCSISVVLLGRGTFVGISGFLSRFPVAAVRRWVETRRQQAIATDAQIARLRASPRATWLATGAFLVGWCFEALESALLLRLVGADVPLRAVFAVEGGLSLVRSIAILAPSGLGVIDLGYATVLPAFGAEAGVTAAFLLLKRAKELAWIAAGYAVLGVMRGRSQEAVPSVAAAPARLEDAAWR
jgi:hypothetical protein